MKPLLTICIPTYNRVESLMILIENLLLCKDMRFNVVVQDNCSSDSTQFKLSTISDSRLFYFRNNCNEGFSANLIKSLTHDISDYILLCLDKDFVDVKYLPGFIDFLDKQCPALGYVDLNMKHQYNQSYLKYSAGFISVKAMSYLSKHPTGYFYKSTIISKEVNEEYFKNISSKFPFPFEVLNAHISLVYDSFIYNIHFIITESEESAKKIKSYTYKKGNLYFSPAKRIEEFSIYWKDVMTLDLDDKVRRALISSLFHSALYLSTFGFQSAMRNDSVLKHYGLEKENVSLLELLGIVKNITNAFLKEAKTSFSNIDIYRILISEYIVWCARFVYYLIKK